MTHDDRLTLDLFGNPTSKLGCDLGIAAFAQTLTDDDDTGPPLPTMAAEADDSQSSATPSDFVLAGDRGLATGWRARARDNIAAIRLATEIERVPPPDCETPI